MDGIGFDLVALSFLMFFGVRWALNAIRHDVGRGERLRLARERRLAF